MPRSRGSDGPQRSSPRVPLYLKTTACSEANSVHRPVAADRSPKVSPRSVLQERKRGMKVADLETKLSKAQEELKKLKDQLVSAEAAKLEAEQALAKAKRRIPAAAPAPQKEEENPLPAQDGGEESVTSPATMDVFEVVVQAEATATATHGENELDSEEKEEDNVVKREEEETKAMIEHGEDGKVDKVATAKVEEKEEDNEVKDLKAKLLEKEKEVEILLEENVIFKKNAEEEAKRISTAAQAKEAELMAKLSSVEAELEESKVNTARLAVQLEAAEGAKLTLEAEMKRLRVQTEQWRKAAEVAASVLADAGVEPEGGRRLSDRCGSMEKHVGWESPLVAVELEDDKSAGGGRRKASGIRMFGELWKKKGQQK